MKITSRFLTLVVLSFGLTSCAVTRSTSFLHPEYDFTQVERVAVVPFEDLSREPGTGSFVTRVFLTELLATGAFDIVEPGEVTRITGTPSQRGTAELSFDKIKKLGDELSVQAVVFGTVGESAELRSSGVGGHVISLNVRMVDVVTGATIWSSAVNTGGPGLFARLLGSGDQSRGTVVRKAVRKSIATLVQ